MKVRSIKSGRDAQKAVKGLAHDYPKLANTIQGLGVAFLHMGVGLRDGRNGASKTYDLSFVDNGRSFATLTATPGKKDRATRGRLRVQVRYHGKTKLHGFQRISKTDSAHWHAMQLAEGDDFKLLLDGLLIGIAHQEAT